MSAAGVLAIIPARGGSKGIPGKNLRPLGGKPLIAYTIEQAVAAASVARVVVSTDSDEIAREACRRGAEVVHRPSALSGDDAPSESALTHCLEHLRSVEGYAPELVVFLQATSPLRSSSDIDRAVAVLRRDGADSLFSASLLHAFVWRVEGDRLLPVTYDPLERPRRQDAVEHLAENGSIYVFKPWVLDRHGCRLGGRIACYRMSASDSVQIDEPDDLPLVEDLMRLRHPEQMDCRADLLEAPRR